MLEKSDLVGALFDGISEMPPWAAFLGKLRLVTHADYATLSFPPRSNELEKTATILADADGVREIDQTSRQDYYFEDRHAWANRLMPEEGRPYSMAELFGSGVTARDAFYLDLVAREGITTLRQLRVRERSGANCWLTLARCGEDFTAADTQLLTDIAPVLRGALQLFVEREKAEFTASLHAETARRLQFGWFTLDARGHILEHDERGAEMLALSRDIRGGIGTLLTIESGKARASFSRALKEIAGQTGSRPHPILISREPWLNLLLMRPRRRLMSGGEHPAAIACLHGDGLASADRAEQIAEFFGLAPREAELALALSRGLSLQEAATEFGLQIGTVRTYSKSLYAKIGARGLADLVRIVMSSVMATAPSGEPHRNHYHLGVTRRAGPPVSRVASEVAHDE